MDYIITNKRREKIINTIVEIVKRLKDNDEVDAILWYSYKGTTITRNVIGFVTLGATDNFYAKTGNVLGIVVVHKGDEISKELQDLIDETEENFENFKAHHKLGVDIRFLCISANECKILSEDDRKKLVELSKMGKYENEYSRAEIIDYINREVYPDGKEVTETREVHYLRGGRCVRTLETSVIICEAKDYVDEYWHITRQLNISHLLLDKSPDGYYTKVATQFKDNIKDIEPPAYDRFVKRKLDLKLGDKVELKLKRDNIS